VVYSIRGCSSHIHGTQKSDYRMYPALRFTVWYNSFHRVQLRQLTVFCCHYRKVMNISNSFSLLLGLFVRLSGTMIAFMMVSPLIHKQYDVHYYIVKTVLFMAQTFNHFKKRSIGLWRWYNIIITILDIIHRPVFYEKSEFRFFRGGGSERHYQDVGGSEITNCVWKVPRRCPLVLSFLFKPQLNSIGLSVPHRKHITSPLRVQQVNAIHRCVTMVY
jgi:hypothetical protein